MKDSLRFFFTSEHSTLSEEDLPLICIKLKPRIIRSISKFDVFCWNRDKISMAEDILADAILRSLIYSQKAERGEVKPVQSFEALCFWNAKNILVDAWRKDKHISLTIDEPLFQDRALLEAMVVEDPSEIVVAELTQQDQIVLIALEIKKLSPKQKEAVLIHIANDADFDDVELCPLERAFWQAGIPLREYRRELPSDPVLRQRHIASLHLGMKAIRKALCCQNNHPDHDAA